jgi:hypothetical protein
LAKVNPIPASRMDLTVAERANDVPAVVEDGLTRHPALRAWLSDRLGL